MDLGYSSEEQAFRNEVRAFIAEHLTSELRRNYSLMPTVFDHPAAVLPWHKALYMRGWVAPGWPKESGGPGWTQAQRFIFEQECAAAHAPNLAPFGVRMVGPVIIKFGSSAQKDYYLPRILSGEDYWCQGYSEPGAGSDLASLQMRAVREGDHYVVTGSKLWTTHAHLANRMFALVRTSDTPRKQDGISFLLIDMDTPGITVRPILTLGGDHEVNQVFFDGARVPCSNLVGKEGAGWTYGKYLLEFERGGTSVAGRLRRTLDDLEALSRRLAGTSGASSSDSFNARFAELSMDLDAFEMMELKALSIVQSGGSPGLIASYVKVVGSETRQAISRLGIDVLGERGLTWEQGRPLYELGPAAILEDDELPVMPNYLNCRATSIYGGSGEIQREIIAKALLG
jgi:acyl-CoA dehydrogenase